MLLTSLLDDMRPAMHSALFTWCSMKSIGYRSLSHKTTLHQTTLQAVSILIKEKPKNGSCVSFPYQTTQGQNLPLRSTKIKIWANNPTKEKKWLILLPSQQSYLTSSSLLRSSEIIKCFLHACTPECRTRALAHLFNQYKHHHTPDTKKTYPSKTFKVQKR